MNCIIYPSGLCHFAECGVKYNKEQWAYMNFENYNEEVKDYENKI